MNDEQGYKAARGAFNWTEGDESAEATVRRMRDGEKPSASDDEAWLAEVRAQLANIPTGDYQVMPPEPNFYWRSVGLRDPDDNERVNQIAEVSVIQIRRGDHIEDRRTLPEFFAAAPDTIRRLLDALDAARRERDAAVRALNALVTDMREVDWNYVPANICQQVTDVLGDSNAKTQRYAAHAAQESDDDHE